MPNKKNPKTKISREKRITGPKVSHTKGYYRFSREFPSVTDSEGYRDNDVVINSPAKKASVRRRFVLLFVCVFIVSFCVTALCFSISNLPVEEVEKTSAHEEQTVPVDSVDRVITISGEEFSSLNSESIISRCTLQGSDSVIIELKDAQGRFYFKPSLSVSHEALASVPDDTAKIISEIKAQGISVFASVSCFADDIYARNNQADAAYVTATDDNGNVSQSIWYGGENGSNAWLSPFSNEVCYYLTTVIGDVAALGVDGIIFENATLPVSAKEENVQFVLSSDYEISVYDKIADWLTYTDSTVSCKTAITLSAAQILDDISNAIAPAYYSAGCDYIIFDARPSDAAEGTVIGTKQFLEPEKTPEEFITDLMKVSFEFLSKNEINAKIIPVLDNSETIDIQLSSLKEFDIDTVIIK